MGLLFLDSSALVKRYVAETGSSWINGLMLVLDADGKPVNTVVVANVTLVEVTSALARRARGGSISKTDAVALQAQFRSEINIRFFVKDLTASQIAAAMDAAEKHVLRGYDAVQLAVALFLNKERTLDGLPMLTFVAADAELLAAAHAEGLPVDNPNLHP